MRFECLQRIIVGTACLGLLVPAQLFAASPIDSSSQTPEVLDIALQEDGVLAGQVLGTNGQPRAAVPVSLRHAGQEIALVSTDQNGYFAVQGVRSGLHSIMASDAVGNYRVWNADSAPPAAQPAALLVSDSDVVRGQGVAETLSNPIVIGAIIATAIAVPVALSNDGYGS